MLILGDRLPMDKVSMLRKSYNWVMNNANEPKALWILIAVTFAESSFFPLPPDPLLMTMTLANERRAFRLATICTITSVVGGWLGYYIGYALFESIGEWIINANGLESAFTRFQDSFQKWGFWIVALKGLTPIPYKVVTIFSGVAKLDLLTFTFASILARGFRFYGLALVMRYAGPGVRQFIEKNLTLVTVGVLLALVGGVVALKYI